MIELNRELEAQIVRLKLELSDAKKEIKKLKSILTKSDKDKSVGEIIEERMLRRERLFNGRSK